MQRQTIFIVILVVFAALSWWLVESQDKVSATFSGAADVDYAVKELRAVTFDVDGQLSRTLHADEARRKLISRETELTQPMLIIHQKDSPPWQIKSKTGEISAAGDWIYLNGEVEVIRESNDPNIRPVHLITRNVSVRPEQAYVETDESVKMYSKQDWVQATGLRAWLREPMNIQLLERVKSFYAPPN